MFRLLFPVPIYNSTPWSLKHHPDRGSPSGHVGCDPQVQVECLVISPVQPLRGTSYRRHQAQEFRSTNGPASSSRFKNAITTWGVCCDLHGGLSPRSHFWQGPRKKYDCIVHGTPRPTHTWALPSGREWRPILCADPYSAFPFTPRLFRSKCTATDKAGLLAAANREG